MRLTADEQEQAIVRAQAGTKTAAAQALLEDLPPADRAAAGRMKDESGRSLGQLLQAANGGPYVQQTRSSTRPSTATKSAHDPQPQPRPQPRPRPRQSPPRQEP